MRSISTISKGSWDKLTLRNLMNEETIEAGDFVDVIEHPETKLVVVDQDDSSGIVDKSVAGERVFSMVQLKLDFGDAG